MTAERQYGAEEDESTADDLIADILDSEKVKAYARRSIGGDDLVNAMDYGGINLIDGVLESNVTALLIGPRGSFKSFVVQGLTWSVGTSIEWLGRQNVGRVGALRLRGGALLARAEVQGLDRARQRRVLARRRAMAGRRAARPAGPQKDAWSALHAIVRDHLDGSPGPGRLRHVELVVGRRRGGRRHRRRHDRRGDRVPVGLPGDRRDRPPHRLEQPHPGRGSSALEANADTVLVMVPTGEHTAQLTATKRRDAEAGRVMDLRFELVDGTSSGVLVEGNGLAGWQTKIRVALAAADEPLTTAELMKRCLVERGGPGHSSFKKGLARLRETHAVTGPRGKHQLAEGAVVSLAGDAGNRVPNRVPSFFEPGRLGRAGPPFGPGPDRVGPPLGHHISAPALVGLPTPLFKGGGPRTHRTESGIADTDTSHAMTITDDPSRYGGRVTCLDCHKPLTRWDSRHRRRGQTCQDRAERDVLDRALADVDEQQEEDE